MIAIKRIYETAHSDDGYRVLVDRLWPRGLTRDAAAIDEWLKDVAPSTELRRWFHSDPGDPGRWSEFVVRYRLELGLPNMLPHLDRFRMISVARPLTLLTATKDEQQNHALVLASVLTAKARFRTAKLKNTEAPGKKPRRS